MADEKVKVVIAFDRDNSKIGKTVDVTEAEARTLISEGRARLASDKGNDNLRGPAGPTEPAPTPEVVSTGQEPSAP